MDESRLVGVQPWLSLLYQLTLNTEYSLPRAGSDLRMPAANRDGAWSVLDDNVCGAPCATLHVSLRQWLS